MATLFKFGLFILCWLVCLWPMELFYVVWHLVEPDSGLARIILVGFGFYFLTGLQIVFGIFGLCATVAIADTN